MSDDKPNQQQLEHKIAAEQLRMLYEQAPMSFALEVVMACFVAWSVSGELGDMGGRTAFWWWLIILAIAVVDFFGYIAYKSKPENYQNYRPWFALFLFSVAVVSSTWGIGLLYLIMLLPITYQLFLVVLLASLAGGALPSMSTRRTPLAIFLTGLLLPSFLWLIQQESSVLRYTGYFLMPYGLALWFGGHQISRHIKQTLMLNFENEQLAGSLKSANGKLQELNQNLTHLSATDPLTQVANRRYFEDRLDKEWKRIVREEGEIAIVMVDIDHFKAFNDSLGHQAGDDCLRKVALSIRGSLRRPADIVARYGGEEFIVMLPNTNPEGAMRVAEMIRENVIHLDVSHPASGTEKVVTVSVGVSHCHPTESTLRKQLIARADEALYQAKESGRNKVMSKPLTD